MRIKKLAAAALAVLLVTGFTTEVAEARGHVGVGVYIGPGWGGGYYGRPWYGPGYGYYGGYYPPAYYGYYPPAVVAVPVQPQTYIEQGDVAPQSAPPAQNYWYYCANPSGYYPYVKDCAGGWQKVSPQPPQSR